MIVLKHIISIVRNTGLLPFNPFAGYINSPESVDRGYLTEEEIQTLIDAPMKNKTHELVRDLFVFSVFPVPSNSCCNTILKKIGVQCGIKTRLTYHVSRHSAATTILLSHGVPIETVSRILGHTNIKTTQIYARITNQKISRDMENLSQKLEGMEKSICEAI
jgi:site-specific recombinase XerD